jgi:hypothetical protein
VLKRVLFALEIVTRKNKEMLGSLVIEFKLHQSLAMVVKSYASESVDELVQQSLKLINRLILKKQPYSEFHCAQLVAYGLIDTLKHFILHVSSKSGEKRRAAKTLRYLSRLYSSTETGGS